MLIQWTINSGKIDRQELDIFIAVKVKFLFIISNELITGNKCSGLVSHAILFNRVSNLNI